MNQKRDNPGRQDAGRKTDQEAVKAFFLACQTARRITAGLPELPEGVVPRDVRIVETVHTLQAERGRVRIGDVSDAMGVTRPSVTSAIGKLAELGYLSKTPDAQDGRTVLVELTEQGENLYDVYLDRYYTWVAQRLASVDPTDLRAAARTVDEVAHLMEGARFEPGGAC